MPTDAGSEIPGLPRRLLDQNFRRSGGFVQRSGYSTSGGTFTLQTIGTSSLEEKLRRSTEKEIARRAEWQRGERFRTSSSRYQHIHPGDSDRFSRQQRQPRRTNQRRTVLMCTGATSTLYAQQTSFAEHTNQLSHRCKYTACMRSFI